MIVVFSEENQRITATALDGAEQRWQEQVEKAQLAIWLKQAADAGRLRRQDALLAVVPETQLTRRIFALPPQAKPGQRRAMAVHALTAVMQERPAALALQQLDAAGHCAVCACKEETLRTLRAPFANYARRLRFVGAADVALARGGPCDDGWYQLTALLWTAVIAVQDGRVVAGRADNSSAAFALEQALREEYRALDLAQPDKVGLLTPDTAAVYDGARLLPCALQPLRAAGLSLREDRTLAALLLLCLVLPGALLLGLALRPAETADPAQYTATQNVVQRSDYATLLSQAYAARDDRITLLGHDAGEAVLALHGRCAEALDLAAYMRALAAVQPSLHPLLLEMTRTSDGAQSYYAFTVQISLEGGEGA